MTQQTTMTHPARQHLHLRRRGVIGLVLALMLGAWIGASLRYAPVARAAAAQTNGRLFLVPAYFYPSGSRNLWRMACNTLPKGSIMILNPNNGPGGQKDENYAAALDFCHAKEINVIGYVYTFYGGRLPTSVKADINKYHQWYAVDGLDGVFLDEMSNEETFASYYQDLYSYIYSTFGSTPGSTPTKVVGGNPGAWASAAWQLRSPRSADMLVGFEGAYRAWASPSYSQPGWALPGGGYDSSNFASLIYATTSKQMSNACATLQSRNIGYVYVTNDKLPNPWDSLPSYLSAEISSCG